MLIAAAVAQALGASYSSGGWWRCRCPVHKSTNASLALRDGDRGLIIYCHAGCKPADIRDELRRSGLLDCLASGSPLPTPPTLRTRDAEEQNRRRRLRLAQDIIAATLPVEDTVAERYLQTRTPGLLTTIPQVLRYIPMGDVYARHTQSGACRPVLVAVVEHVDFGVVGCHRTWLALNGSGKASLDPVRVSTGPIKGGSVRLAPASETLMVGEGIETCLSAMVATGMPAWAALSTSGLIALDLPLIVKNVVILADNDQSGAGQRAAYAAAHRWIAEGRQVRIATPPESETDFNDVLLGRSGARIAETPDVAA